MVGCCCFGIKVVGVVVVVMMTMVVVLEFCRCYNIVVRVLLINQGLLTK